EKIEAAGITSLEKLASMTPEQLMEIPGIGEKMVDKIYQSVNRFYEGGEAAAAPAEASTEAPEEAGEPVTEAEAAAPEPATENEAEATEAALETVAESSTEAAPVESTAENHSAAAEPAEKEPPETQQEEKSS